MAKKRERLKIQFGSKVSHRGKPCIYIGKEGKNIMGEGIHILVSEKTKKILRFVGKIKRK